MKRISLATIANIVGVSKPVVSTVLGNREGSGIFVSKHNRDRIHATARELGYVLPKSGRELVSGKSNNIGVILHRFNPPFPELIKQLCLIAIEKNLEITPYIVKGSDMMEEYYLKLIRDKRVDGIIIIGGSSSGNEKRYQEHIRPPYNLKILFYGEPIPGVASIHFDSRQAGILAARHLTECGCRRLACFGGNKDSARIRGFVPYLEEKGFPSPLIFTGEPNAWSYLTAKTLAQEFLKLKDLPDGVFAANDLFAMALLTEAVRKGLRVPEDIAIMGFDNIDCGLYTIPSLTSIDTNFALMAKMAIEKMEKIIKGEHPEPFHTNLPVSLIVRESTKRG